MKDLVILILELHTATEYTILNLNFSLTRYFIFKEIEC